MKPGPRTEAARPAIPTDRAWGPRFTLSTTFNPASWLSVPASYDWTTYPCGEVPPEGGWWVGQDLNLYLRQISQDVEMTATVMLGLGGVVWVLRSALCPSPEGDVSTSSTTRPCGWGRPWVRTPPVLLLHMAGELGGRGRLRTCTDVAEKVSLNREPQLASNRCPSPRGGGVVPGDRVSACPTGCHANR